jgi:peptidoglycan/xylan/chitin deacetylase (PgdA/CDA1 family)
MARGLQFNPAGYPCDPSCRMIITYHEIVPTPSRYVYSTTVVQLEEHLAAIHNLPPDLPQPPITFDDGHASQHRYALPLLEKARTKALFFVTSGWTGVKPEYMDWRQLAELICMGHEVQSHGWSHALLTNCTPPQLSEELRRSRLTLEDRLATPVNAISVPGGRFNAEVLRACHREGYQRVFVSNPYLPVSNSNRLTVAGRAMIRHNHGAAELVALLRSENKRFSPQQVGFRVKQSIRTLVGDRFYHQVLWQWFGAPGEKSAINEDYAAK